MKGYFTDYGYMGWIGNRYMLFATPSEYREYYYSHIKHTL